MEELHTIHELLGQSQRLRDEGRIGEANGCASEAVRICNEAGASVGTETRAEATLELANVLFCDHMFREAEQNYITAIRLLEGLYYPSHPELMPALDHLARLYIRMERLADARKVSYRLLDIMKSSLLGSDCWYIEAVRMTAVVELALRNSNEADVLISKVLPIVDNSTIGPAEEFYWLLAKIKEAQGQTDAAKKNYEAAINIFFMGRDNYRKHLCLKDYANFLDSLNDKGELNFAPPESSPVRPAHDLVDNLPNSAIYQRVPYAASILH